MSENTFHESAAQIVSLIGRAEEVLITAVEEMKRRLRLTQSTDDLVRDIKSTIYLPLPPHGFTVIQTLCERERDKVFNQLAADLRSETREEFGNAIQDFAIVRDGRTPARKIRKIAENAWKADYAADRRALDPQRSGDSGSPYRGRPEKYDPSIVWAFADKIASVVGRKQFSTGHHGDVTITNVNKAGGPMLGVLVAAIQWAMTIAWQPSAKSETEVPTVKPEGVLSILKRGR